MERLRLILFKSFRLPHANHRVTTDRKASFGHFVKGWWRPSLHKMIPGPLHTLTLTDFSSETLRCLRAGWAACWMCLKIPQTLHNTRLHFPPLHTILLEHEGSTCWGRLCEAGEVGQSLTGALQSRWITLKPLPAAYMCFLLTQTGDGTLEEAVMSWLRN